MRIDQLPVASTIGNTDTLPFSDGGITKQISVGNLTNSIRDNVYGAPLTASTSSAMTDTSRIYVYTGTTGGGFTNGHWYYYNGSAWTDGGIYNSIAVQTDPTLTLEGVPADAKATGELKTVIDDKLAEFDVAVETFYPHDGYNGPMVTVEGTVDAPPAELVIYGKSVQGFAPSPSAPKEIVTAGSGGTLPMVSAGKNLFTRPYYRESTSGSDPYTHNGVTFTLNSDGSITANGTATGGQAFYNIANATQQTHIIPAGTYMISGGVSTNKTVYVRNADSSVIKAAGINPVTFVLTELSAINAVILIEAGTTCNNDVFRPQIEPGNEATGYAAPISNATVAIPTELTGLPGIPVASGGNYTDTGGQRWLCDTIDLEAGTWTKRVASITIPSSSVTYNALEGAPLGYAVRYSLPQVMDPNQRVFTLCSHFDALDNVAAANLSAGKVGISNSGQTAFFVVDASIVDDATAQAWFAANTVRMVYAIAAPVVNQLTDAQVSALRAIRGRKGLTNLYSADLVGPDIKAEMYIDIPTYIQSLLSQMDRGFNVTAVNNGLEFTSIE